MDGMQRRPGRTPAAGLAGLLAILVASFVLAACGGTGEEVEEAVPPIDRGPFGGLVRGEAAPELAGTGEWFNSEPFTLEGLRDEGHVVLVDFWTYSCVNCLRTLPFLRDWHERYGPHGLVILGVHTPEFLFEHRPENVARAIAEDRVTWPVVQDNQRETWKAFSNSVWPAKYLVGVDGHIVYRHFGEGQYEETELALRAALEAAGRDLTAVPPGNRAAPRLDESVVRMTRELYFGYQANFHPAGVYAAQREYYDAADAIIDFQDPGPPRLDGVWYAHGVWNNDQEAMVHFRSTNTVEDYLVFAFTARTVNPVMAPPRSGPVQVRVLLDGFPLQPEEAGPDVEWDEVGYSVVTVDEPRMYRVVDLPRLGEHTLRLGTMDEGLAVYSATFGAYTEGP
jgi:thiol-disulfide isomerase/thioredoxin